MEWIIFLDTMRHKIFVKKNYAPQNVFFQKNFWSLTYKKISDDTFLIMKVERLLQSFSNYCVTISYCIACTLCTEVGTRHGVF